MKERQLGTLLVIIAILMTAISILVKLYRDVLNSCISCSYLVYTIIWFISGLILVTGLMLRRSGEIGRIIAESSLKMNREFEEAKKKEREKERFQDFLKDFSKEERDVIELLHTHEGMTLDELGKKSGLSGQFLGKTIKHLQKKEIVAIIDKKKAYLLKFSR